jgi:hypothetical protein
LPFVLLLLVLDKGGAFLVHGVGFRGFR